VNTACTCGSTEPHTVARRRAADGTRVALWSDGSVSGPLGYALDGVPMRRPRSAESHDRAMRAGWLFLGEVGLYDADELGLLYAACERVARAGGAPGDARAAFAALTAPALPTPKWEVYRTDRDGKPTLRWWRLPRLFWPGLVVMDHCGHEAGPRYRVCRVAAHEQGTARFTGMAFANQADLAAYLAEVRS